MVSVIHLYSCCLVLHIDFKISTPECRVHVILNGLGSYVVVCNKSSEVIFWKNTATDFSLHDSTQARREQ